MSRVGTRKVVSKRDEADRIRREREAFIAKGGAIERVASGVFGDRDCTTTKTMRRRIGEDVDQCNRERMA